MWEESEIVEVNEIHGMYVMPTLEADGIEADGNEEY